MLIHSKNLLMTEKKKYTLTVVTNPASATCTLTYDGQSYSSKTATVEDGTIISYSVYHSTYGTKTGSITLDSDKTLTFTGTYSTSTVDTPWSQPVLSANGTMGGSSFAVSADYEAGGYLTWKAFDGNNSTGWSNGISTGYIIMYNPTAIKVSKFTIRNRSDLNRAFQTGNILAGNSQNNLTTISNFSNSNSTAGSTWDINVNASSAYKYWKIDITASIGGSTCAEITISATTTTTSYTYYWDVTTT